MQKHARLGGLGACSHRKIFEIRCFEITSEAILGQKQSRSSLVPRPHPKNRERGLVSLANFPVCAESAYYATHPNNHIYVIDLVRLSRGKNSKKCNIIDNGML